ATEPPPGPDDCNNWSSTGLHFARTITTADSGRTVLIDDHISSTDNKPHTFATALWQPETGSAPGVGFLFPWNGASMFSLRTGLGTDIGAPPAGQPYAFYAKEQQDAPDGSLGHPTGAGISDTPPSAVRFSTFYGDQYIEYRKQEISAGGSVHMR